MARIEITPAVFDDFDRFVDHMTRFDVPDQVAKIGRIVEALQILRDNPEIGRRVSGGRRELVIGEGSQGYVALYRYAPRMDTVIVVAIRSQREGGYKRDE